ncbi:MAG: HAMP domain-containing sensor histidine kinase, partial [Bacteroidota bacterium]
HLTHEFKTPLASMMLASKTIPLAADPNKRQDLAQLITREGQRLEGHIDRVLQLVQSRSQAFVLEREPTDMKGLLLQTLDRLSLLMEQKQVQVEWDWQTNQLVSVDMAHWENVYFNLLENALKYGPESGGTLFLSASQEDTSWTFTIRDQGPGIAQSVLSHIWEPFVQQTSAKGGFGLGLPYVKRIVEAHGGKISARNHTIGGAEFVIWLPLTSLSA